MHRQEPGRHTRSYATRRNAISFRKPVAVTLLLVGSCRVGKSALVHRWVQGVFHDEYVPTVENFHLKSFTHLGQRVSVGVIDLSGSGQFPAMFELYVNKTDSIMYVYEVGNENSIQELCQLHKQVLKLRGDHHNLIQSVVGTKIDRVPDKKGIGYKSLDLERLLAEMGQPKHVVTSAKLDLNLLEAFENALSPLVSTILPSATTLKKLGERIKGRNKRSWLKLCWAKSN